MGREGVRNISFCWSVRNILGTVLGIPIFMGIFSNNLQNRHSTYFDSFLSCILPNTARRRSTSKFIFSLIYCWNYFSCILLLWQRTITFGSFPIKLQLFSIWTILRWRGNVCYSGRLVLKKTVFLRGRVRWIWVWSTNVDMVCLSPVGYGV